MSKEAPLQEHKRHGALRFPFTIYPCTIPGDFLQVALHWQDSMELIYVKKGRGIVQVGMTPYEARAGEIYLLAPGTLHALRRAEGCTMEYENFIFDTELLGGNGDVCAERYLLPLQSGRLPLPARLVPGEPVYPQAAACLREAELANRDRPTGYELTIKGALLRFLALVLARGGAEPLPDTRDTRRMKTLLQWLQNRDPAPVAVAEAAAVCGCSPAHFMRWFKQMTGQGFTAFCNEQRLNTAAEALRAGDDAILEIAERSGFDNLSYFNRLFKQRFGMTPRDYRKANQL